MISVTVSLIFGAMHALLAYKKGKDPLFWFIVGAFLTVFSLLFLYFLPPTRKKQEEPNYDERGFSGTTIEVEPIVEKNRE